MTTANYAPPLDRLLTYGECLKVDRNRNYVEELGLGSEHIPELIRMASDRELNKVNSAFPETWAPIHAWRSLGQLEATEAIEPLIAVIRDYPDTVWTGIEMPQVFANIGPEAIPALAAYLGDRSHEKNRRTIASSCLTEIGKKHPDVRDECVNILNRQLELYTQNPPLVNSFLIESLVILGSVESLSAIERVLNSKRVDPEIGPDWEEVQVGLGLKEAEGLSEEEIIAQHLQNQLLAEEAKKSQGFGGLGGNKKKKSGKKKKK